jgi:tetratricopeptide (TPR) repeat protein
MTARTAALACVVSVLAGWSSPAAQVGVEGQRSGVGHLLIVERWSRAVLDHQPGRHDSAVDFVNGMTPEDRKRLASGLDVFLRALTKKALTTMEVEAKRLAELGADASRTPGTNQFLARAAALHADAAMIAPYSISEAPKVSPIGAVETGGIVAVNDGEFRGVVVSNWGWAFGRRLLDQTQPGPAGDPFVAAWYHATAAFMMQRGYLGEAAPHLDRAMQIFSNDARIVFDKACLAEALGLPRARQAMEDPRTQQVLAPPNLQPGFRSGAAMNNVVAGKNTLLSKVQTEAEAERWFRRAFSLDPTMGEARIRLGRLYESQGRHDAALTELTAGIRLTRDEVARFFGHLFAARASTALKRPADAAAHVKQALALFPNAQSALIAASQLALVNADASAALEAVRRLSQIEPETRGDPWWHYHSGMGRYADTLLQDLWDKTIPRGRQPEEP